MNVSFIKWKNWDAVKCSVGQATLIAGVSAGPRILSFHYNNGENILYEDHTGFGVGEWLMYGGHRFTIAPENEDSYYADNAPCEVKLDSSAVRISARQRFNGLLLSLVIRPSLQEGFYIDHVLQNNGLLNWQGALWAITCVPRSHTLSGACQTAHIHFWPGSDTSKWKLNNGKVHVKTGNFRGKIGWYNNPPVLTALSPQGEFTISSPDATVPALCVDNGSNSEIFVCSHWAELETLSEKFLVSPGAWVSHRQHWQFKPV